MLNKKLVRLTILALTAGQCQFAFAQTVASEPAATQILNAHGAEMQLQFKLYEPGTETVVDYDKYGTFENAGTPDYRYKVTDRKGLAAAVGEGVYPNNSVYKDPAYRMFVTKGRLAGSQWDYVNHEDQQLAFYKWATTHDTPAVQQYFTARALENLGEVTQAIKGYHAVMVHFPKQNGWTIWHTPMYLAKTAMDRIEYLTHKYPELGIRLVGAKIDIKNGFDFNIANDQFIVNPGRLVRVAPSEIKIPKQDLKKQKIVKTVGKGSVQLVQFENRHWQLRVDNKPYPVKAIAYVPTPIGKTPDRDGYDPNTGWMTSDLNANGVIDAPFETWVDKNRNNQQDPDEKIVGDFELMKRMGVNTIRIYHHATNKELLRKLYNDYGIRVIMGDCLGMYGAGSGAAWYEGTDYTNEQHKANMRESVKKMVLEYKDEPFVLMWMLGNESNYGEVGDPDPKSGKPGMGSNARNQTDAHYAFVDEVAAMIKQMDPDRLVGFSNGETITIDAFAKYCKHVDIFGANVYRGEQGPGRSFWEDVRDVTDKPALLTEYGCPAYYNGKDIAYAEIRQYEYHKGNWEDIAQNMAGSGFGNSLGGVVFEFVDEWWKAGPPPQFNPEGQETVGQFQSNFPDGWMHEEWLGVTSQGDGTHSPYLRQLRKAYHYYEKVWNS